MGEGTRSSGKKRNKTHTLCEGTCATPAASVSKGNLDGATAERKRKKVVRNKKREGAKLPEAKTTETMVKLNNPDDVYEGKTSAGLGDKKKKKLKKKKRNTESTKEDGAHEYVAHSNEVGDDSNHQNGNLDCATAERKRRKVVRNKKREGAKLPEAETTETMVSNNPDDVYEGKTGAGMGDEKKKKLKKKKRNTESTKEDGAHEYVAHPNEVRDDSNHQNGKSKNVSSTENDAALLDDEDEVYQISSGDEDETTGMRRWITEYHHSRPAVEVLWKRINDFLVDYRAQKEKEREEKEAEAAEGGWTVVAHHKGRKKTTDPESGVTVGSVAQAAVMDKMAKKKDKQVGLSFYRFQRREAQRNEIMMLQSKFEQDKKRIQQMRAERKFRPY